MTKIVTTLVVIKLSVIEILKPNIDTKVQNKNDIWHENFDNYLNFNYFNSRGVFIGKTAQGSLLSL